MTMSRWRVLLGAGGVVAVMCVVLLALGARSAWAAPGLEELPRLALGVEREDDRVSVVHDGQLYAAEIVTTHGHAEVWVSRLPESAGGTRTWQQVGTTTTPRATRLGRFGRALTIALAVGVGVGVGVASMASPATALTSATYDLKGTVPGIDVFGVHSKVLACPVRLGLRDVDWDSHAGLLGISRHVVSREPPQVGVKVMNLAPIVRQKYHVTFRCEGPVDFRFN